MSRLRGTRPCDSTMADELLETYSNNIPTCPSIICTQIFQRETYEYVGELSSQRIHWWSVAPQILQRIWATISTIYATFLRTRIVVIHLCLYLSGKQLCCIAGAS